ncbi:1-phosphatidylinositol-3-phosphate 5-kinase FAB1 [Anopheles sinensis]|uniref:1-phosphatidylinositol-3-phosphate 5-kinase FAB1 n=1 Tax=Anopheles sinensis TaxID=74873 RepID=A0A084VA08_ANOSI|nr:1-phosphatidylinositol-3-phosphate 5-kinase FAB1 [Anopheles sinensis]
MSLSMKDWAQMYRFFSFSFWLWMGFAKPTVRWPTVVEENDAVRAVSESKKGYRETHQHSSRHAATIWIKAGRQRIADMSCSKVDRIDRCFVLPVFSLPWVVDFPPAGCQLDPGDLLQGELTDGRGQTSQGL